MSKLVYLIHGPNLNMLGKRQPEIYGAETLADVEAKAAGLARELGLNLRSMQSNHEGQLVDWIQEARADACGIVINAGAYTHTSVAILDALKAFDGIVMEVHISNVHQREEFRHHSYISLRANGVIVGCGTDGYGFALRRIVSLLG